MCLALAHAIMATSSMLAQQPFELTNEALTWPNNEPAPCQPVPTERQLAWNETEFYAFFHYGMNTYTGKEWGNGDEKESIFAPTAAPNPRQWLEAVKAAGMNSNLLLNIGPRPDGQLPDEAVKVLEDVGLGYIRLGQAATTLSGGEAQRIKLASELSKKGTGRTMYILDEPTTGLHTADVHKLLQVLQRLVDSGNTVVVIEHNLDVIKTADYLIDLGPEGGDKGGTVVGTGTPEQLARNKTSYTGQYLKKVIDDAKKNGKYQ